jgi:hypothetical protein
MRRLLSVAAAALLALTVAAPAMAGANNVNTSGSAQFVNGEWSDESSNGYVSFVTDSSYGLYGEFYEESGEWIACDDTGEYYGFVGTRTYGFASELTIDLDSRLDHAEVSGRLELLSETVNDCTGDYVGGGKDGGTSVGFSASLDGVGSVARFRDSGSFKVPGDYNSHSRQSGKLRDATGSIQLQDSALRQFGWAMLANANWSEHSNG